MNQHLREKIDYLTTLPDYLLPQWYKSNKKDALAIVSTLENTDIVRDQHGRIKFRQAIWHYRNNVFTPIKCKNSDCNNFVKWNDTKHCYQQFCSNQCVHQDGSLIDRRKQTCIERYGVDNVFRNKDYMKHRREQTLGVPHANQDTGILNKSKQVFTERYGVDHPWKNPSIRKKCTNTRFADSKYHQLDQHVLDYLQDQNWMYQQLIIQNQTQQQLADRLNVAQSTIGLYAAQHNIDSQQRSKVQQQITDFIVSHYTGQINTNVRDILDDGKELDIVLPDIKLAFEVNGIFWHSELNGKNKKYHQNKLKTAYQAGYKLIMINDVEWFNKQHIVKSRIKSQLQSNQKIYARQTKCERIDSTTYRDFVNQHHIQQYVPASIAYGLFDQQDQLVAVMSFGVSRYNGYQYELLRYCCNADCNVIGGPSKLFSKFIKQYQPEAVVSFGDCRWGDGSLYQKLGFDYLGMTDPNYHYFKRNNTGYQCVLYSRVHFQKHKLHNKLEHFDPNLTEWQNMVNNGYDRIWDCGNTKWLWKPVSHV